MDGFKAKLNSLHLRLALTLSILLVIAAISIGAISFYSTQQDAHELQDDHLRDFTAMIIANGINPSAFSDTGLALLKDPDTKVVPQLIDNPEQNTLDDRKQLHIFPNGLELGFNNIQIEQTEWRVLVRTWPGGGKLVVGQNAEAKNEIARHTGHRTFYRILFAIPVLIGLLSLMLHWTLSPLSRLTKDLKARHAEDLSPISSESLPTEMLQFVLSINEMLNKISMVMSRQRRFVADAAHELRSPLTALTLQAENLSEQEMSDSARGKLGEFAKGLRRANELIDQLLTMARTQLADTERPVEVHLPDLVKNVYEELMPLADSRNIELEYLQEGAVDIKVTGATQSELVILLRNLVDNAIRYSQAHSKVEVSIIGQQRALVIKVIDNGPGIPEAELSRVFDSFYRILGTGQSGSGLGLSIAQSIAKKIGAEISLQYTDSVQQRGTTAVVHIPNAK